MMPATTTTAMSPRDIVTSYFAMGFRCVFWPQIGDDKFPRHQGWQHEITTLDAFRDGNRVGVLTGCEIGVRNDAEQAIAEATATACGLLCRLIAALITTGAVIRVVT